MTTHTLGQSSYITLKDGRKLHYREQGSGSPTVVFESGMGFSSALWGCVQPAVARETSVVAYDRAGTGKSHPDDEERTLNRLSDDLEQLLQHFSGPLILVGYSWGGPIVRTVAARRTSDIRGIVLVEQADERNPEYFTEAGRGPLLLRLLKLWLMHTVGLAKTGWRVLRDMPADCRRSIIWRDLALKGIRSYDAELGYLIPGLRQLREHEDPLTGIDVTVITGTESGSWTSEYRPAMVEAHRETAAALDRGRLVEANSSAHFVPITQPKLVIREVSRLIEVVKRQSSASGSIQQIENH